MNHPALTDLTPAIAEDCSGPQYRDGAGRHVLARDNSPHVEVIDEGASIESIQLVPADSTTEVAVGFASRHQRKTSQQAFFGSVIGRYANRIQGGRARIAGRDITLARNDGDNTLHSGANGFHVRDWTPKRLGNETIEFILHSPDGDQGFPGALYASACYQLIDDGLRLDLEATSSTHTLCLMTSHLYINLAGHGPILDQHLTVDADHYVPVDPQGIPLGELCPVEGTALDLRTATTLRHVVRSQEMQVAQFGGLDHSFAIRGAGFRRHARLDDPYTGRQLEVWSDAPALQVYTGNNLDGSSHSRTGDAIGRHHAIAFEPQQHPDAPHQPWRSGIYVTPDRPWRCRIEWRFAQRVPS